MNGYEPIDYFFPYLSSQGMAEMDAAIEKYKLESQHNGEYHSPDGQFIMMFSDAMHERDSSNDHWILYKKKAE